MKTIDAYYLLIIKSRILLSYDDNGEVVLSGKGTGGLTEMKEQLNANQVFFGVARVRAVDDHGSKRAKFVFITYSGAGVVSCIVFSNKFFYEIFYLISLHYVVLVFRFINLNLKDFSMVIIFKFMPILRMIYPKNQLLHHYIHVLVHINHKHMNSLNYFLPSFFFKLMLILFMSLLCIDIFLHIADQSILTIAIEK
jgi:hypothetical protein